MDGDEITKLLLDEHGIRTAKTTIRPGGYISYTDRYVSYSGK